MQRKEAYAQPRKMFWPLFFLLLSKELAHSEILRLPCSTFANFTEMHRDRSVMSSFKTIFGIDVYTCKLECISDSKCKSINVSEDDGVCELNAKAAEDPKDKIKTHLRYGWTYYSTLYNQTSIGESCLKKNLCLQGEKCIDVCSCPGHKCINLNACSDWYRNGAKYNGIYHVFDSTNKTNKVYCDFVTDSNFAWTLVMSSALKYYPMFRGYTLRDSLGLASKFPNWDLYRLKLIFPLRCII
ncbi:uncharacterized protein LOC135690862 isoform X2 [Rhopilema esculentum]|uniref:uncharacterized protein LOC135690862 isoform X2 n=1 Tax=Rhopilema esculentum TaxID=499914 RepID=UPI0031DA985E